MFILATADGRKGEGLSAACGLSGQVWRVSQGNCWRMWSVGSSMASGSRGLLAECGLSGQVWRVGQENCWRSVVCRGEIAEWVKKIVGGVWSVGAKRASGSRGLLAECGLSGRKCCVGQRNWRRSVVCRGEKGEWVKGIVGRVWSVGAKRASGSRGLSAGLVCRVKYGEWVKRIVGGVWSVGSSMASESRGLSVGVVCRGENVAWVKGTVARVWSVGVKRASEPKKPHISYASNVANCHSDQNCQNPQNMIHLL